MSTNIDVNENLDQEELTVDEKKEQIRELEGPLLNRLLAASEYAATEELKIEIVRKGTKYFEFTVHPLSEATMLEIKKKYTKYKTNKLRGVKVPQELDIAKFRCSVIYNSTIPEDQERIWNNKEFQEGLRKQGNVIVNALDVIEATLLPGEKERIVDMLDELGGFVSEESEDDEEEKKIDEAKNL